MLCHSEEAKRQKILNQEHNIRKCLFKAYVQQELSQTPGRSPFAYPYSGHCLYSSSSKISIKTGAVAALCPKPDPKMRLQPMEG